MWKLCFQGGKVQAQDKKDADEGLKKEVELLTNEVQGI